MPQSVMPTGENSQETIHTEYALGPPHLKKEETKARVPGFLHSSPRRYSVLVPILRGRPELLETKIERLGTNTDRWEAKVWRVEQAIEEGTAYLRTTEIMLPRVLTRAIDQ